MKKYFFLLLLFAFKTKAQELFAYTEPASNMPSKSAGIRLNNMLMKQQKNEHTSYYLLPELMLAVNKNLMLHAEGIFSNKKNAFALHGASVYGKYRFLSNDQVHSHFRMAAYSRLSINNSTITQQEIETNWLSSGFETGVIATKLINRLALSSSFSYEHALDKDFKKLPSLQAANAVNYTLSAGKLFLPKEYKNYRQINMNMMLEFLGQALPGKGRSYMDIAPAVQFIFNSQGRIDIGYRTALYNNMQRDASHSFLLRFEYLFFNMMK